MEFLFLLLISFNVFLVLALALAASARGRDQALKHLQGRRVPDDPAAALARRQRLDAEENAWRYEE